MQEMENRIPLVPGLGPGGHSDHTLTCSGLHVVHTLHPKQLFLGQIPTKTHREAAFAETYSDLINPKLRESEALEQDGILKSSKDPQVTRVEVCANHQNGLSDPRSPRLPWGPAASASNSQVPLALPILRSSPSQDWDPGGLGWGERPAWSMGRMPPWAVRMQNLVSVLPTQPPYQHCCVQVASRPGVNPAGKAKTQTTQIDNQEFQAARSGGTESSQGQGMGGGGAQVKGSGAETCPCSRNCGMRRVLQVGAWRGHCRCRGQARGAASNCLPASSQPVPRALGGDLQGPGVPCPIKHPGLHRGQREPGSFGWGPGHQAGPRPSAVQSSRKTSGPRGSETPPAGSALCMLSPHYH